MSHPYLIHGGPSCLYGAVCYLSRARIYAFGKAIGVLRRCCGVVDEYRKYPKTVQSTKKGCYAPCPQAIQSADL